MARVLAFRFDVDSVRCAEEGIPNLMRMADRTGVRFSFFVNMGYSFNWTHNVTHSISKWRHRRKGERPLAARSSLPTTKKLGLRGVLKTMILNPRLGDRYRNVFDTLHHEGHELGLHGGMDHVIWQRSLHRLDDAQIEALFAPAYRRFEDRYGRPAGFASPGFVHDERILALVDRYGFRYASDMAGQEPFRAGTPAGEVFVHVQVPVNVAGQGNVPLVEQGLARGLTRAAILNECLDAIRARQFALLYGHPYVEGVHASLLEEVIRELAGEYEVATVDRYLTRWSDQRDG